MFVTVFENTEISRLSTGNRANLHENLSKRRTLRTENRSKMTPQNALNSVYNTGWRKYITGVVSHTI